MNLFKKFVQECACLEEYEKEWKEVGAKVQYLHKIQVDAEKEEKRLEELNQILESMYALFRYIERTYGKENFQSVYAVYVKKLPVHCLAEEKEEEPFQYQFVLESMVNESLLDRSLHQYRGAYA